MVAMNRLAPALAAWYATAARDLPWRRAEATPWAILVSEIMLQQTPAQRVLPAWTAWLERWPRPRDLAVASAAEVISAWGRLGYPRRALRLRECAAAIAEGYGDQVPGSEVVLRGLPGIGEYTAAAVACFAYGQRTVVLDTNIRRVLTRAIDGQALPPPHLSAAERRVAAELLPEAAPDAVVWNQATMELGALHCRARGPECDPCPLRSSCAWRVAGHPGDLHAGRRRPQPWEGTNRQARGRVMARLRDAEGGIVPIEVLVAESPRPGQTRQIIDDLIADGLAERAGDGLRLPA